MQRPIIPALLITALALAACTGSADPPVTTQAGPFTVDLRLNTNPPKEHGNELDIVIKDGDGARISGVDVRVAYSMPAMGAMPAMNGSAEVVPRGTGLFRALFDLPMGGTWTFDVDLRRGNEHASTSFGLTVGRKGLTLKTTQAESDVSHYTCPMHSSVREPGPGKCPICSMDLVPVRRSEADTGIVNIGTERLQSIGVRMATASRRRMTLPIRTVGRVVYDETRLVDVSIKYRGWIGTLYANATGQRVEKGEPLFTLYSPELFSAQQELLGAIRSRNAAATGSVPDRADYLVDAARQRLRLWDLTAAQIDAIVRSDSALEYVPILSPASGFVVEKNVVAGASVDAGARLFRIASLDTVWIEAEIYDAELDAVRVGTTATIVLPYPGRPSLEGRVSFVFPYLDDVTRTVRVRIEVANPEYELKPDMYADVALDVDLGERLVIPEEAVLYVGDRRFVFVSLGEGKLAPRRIEVGHRSEDMVEILEGLSSDEQIVASGNFLIAAESRLKLAMEHWQ